MTRQETAHPAAAGMCAPGSTATAVKVEPDERFAPCGRARPLPAYDAGQAPAPRPANSPGADLLAADPGAVAAAVDERLAPLLAAKPRHVRSLLRWVRLLLGWLERFPGADWEQRWLASGADLGTWARHAVSAGVGSRPTHPASALALLLLARVVRPSYSFLLNTSFTLLFDRFPQLHDGDEFTALRAMPAYQRVVDRLQMDAEACLIRVMIRTGKRMRQLAADDLLTYSDLVKTSGRHRREHLA